MTDEPQPLRHAASDYKAAVNEVLNDCSEHALVTLRKAEEALHLAAMAGCYECGRTDEPKDSRGCQCWNDE